MKKLLLQLLKYTKYIQIMQNKIILASKSKVRKNILDKNNIESVVEPSNVDEDIVKLALLKENANPEIISKNIGSYNLEERSVNYFIVKASDQKAKDFTDLEINEYFKKNKENFKTKEFRDVETLLLDAKKFAENTTVTEDEIQILYEERKESLIKPERRYLKQMG